MNTLDDIITYIRRIVKTPSDQSLSDSLIIDYINRFYLMDMDGRLQLYDYKTKYQFQTTPGIDRYNMPLYNVQSETSDNPSSPDIGMYPVYQGFLGPAYINGVPVQFQTQKEYFYNAFPKIVQGQQIVAVGDGSTTTFQITMPTVPGNSNPPNQPINSILRGHIDITGIMTLGVNQDPPVMTNSQFISNLNTIPSTSIDSMVFITTTAADGSNIVVADSGVFLTGNTNYGMLMVPGNAPYGNTTLPSPDSGDAYRTDSNTINYLSGVANVTFPIAPPAGVNIYAQCFFYQTGLPRAILYYNNCLVLRNPPAYQYLVELDAYLSPAAFFNSSAAIPFGYMAEYIARGAARKILSDVGDVEQFQFYEPLFREQESLVWKRSQRQWTSTRTQTIYSQGMGLYAGQSGFNNTGTNSF